MGPRFFFSRGIPSRHTSTFPEGGRPASEGTFGGGVTCVFPMCAYAVKG
jgi:hypothetical protein